jgi:Ca2+-transporting ATPase
MDPALLAALAPGVHVFARVSPAQKLQIVQALQRAGQVVAMTGDGVNDGPALKAADVGVAMGRQGTRLARDTADMVISDDSLGHLVEGIEQGRTILANIRKSLHFLLATNASEVLLVTAEILLGPKDVESPLELFWINLVTDLFPGLGLALEPAEPGVLEVPPRAHDERLLGAAYYRRLFAESAVMASAAMAAHLFGRARYGPGPRTRSVTFMTLVSAQLLHASSCRSDRLRPGAGSRLPANPVLTGALGASFALQALAFALPPLRRLLGLAPLSPTDLVVAGLASLGSFVANETLLEPADAAPGRPRRRRRRRARPSTRVARTGPRTPAATKPPR